MAYDSEPIRKTGKPVEEVLDKAIAATAAQDNDAQSAPRPENRHGVRSSGRLVPVLAAAAIVEGVGLLAMALGVC